MCLVYNKIQTRELKQKVGLEKEVVMWKVIKKIRRKGSTYYITIGRGAPIFPHNIETDTIKVDRLRNGALIGKGCLHLFLNKSDAYEFKKSYDGSKVVKCLVRPYHILVVGETDFGPNYTSVGVTSYEIPSLKITSELRESEKK